MKYAQQRLAIADDIGSAELRAWGLVELGVVHLARGDLEAAATVLEEGRALAREGGDWRTEWRALLNLGGVALYSGDYARSEAATRAALDLSRGDRSGATAEALRLLASVTRRTGRRDEALQLLRESLTLDAQLGSIHGVSRALDELAVLLASEGRRCDAIAIAAAAKAAHV